MNTYRAVVRTVYYEVYQEEAESEEAFRSLLETGFLNAVDAECQDWDIVEFRTTPPKEVSNHDT